MYLTTTARPPGAPLARLFDEGQLEADRLAGFGDTSPVPAQVRTTPSPLTGKALDLIDALVFSSSHDGRSHVVSVSVEADGSRTLRCTCKAMRSIDYRPDGCWALVAGRSVLGLA